jgi:cobalt-zinc-cadmium efflux system membrane fusion protein
MQKLHKYIPVSLWVVAGVFILLATACDHKSPEKNENKVEIAKQGELCTAHQLPVNDCFMCDPALRDPDRLWCKEHNRYEDRCFICHPELKDENRLWCSEHNLYEDECIFCHPELKDKQAGSNKETAGTDDHGSSASADLDLQCIEHGVLERECGICHPELADALQPGQGLKIRFESPESAKKAGIGLTNPLPGEGLSDLSLLCRVTYNLNQFAQITPFASGVIQRVLTDVGDMVSKGQVLVRILSPEIAKSKSAYLIALANENLKETAFKRKKELLDEKIAAQGDYDMAATEYELAKSTTAAAYQQLLNYGFSSNDIVRIKTTRSTNSMLQVLAPFTGTLIERHAVVGETVEPGKVAFKIADLSTMWLELSIPEDRIGQVSVGNSVEATFDVLPETRIQGELTWVSAGIDEQTRMLKGRAVVSNPDMRLKHGMFGRVRIDSKHLAKGLYVPVESVHHFGPDRSEYVFTKVTDDLFEIRRVEMGAKNRAYVEILKGLVPEDLVVSAHSFTVKSEFLKARLGAGCVDE